MDDNKLAMYLIEKFAKQAYDIVGDQAKYDMRKAYLEIAKEINAGNSEIERKARIDELRSLNNDNEWPLDGPGSPCEIIKKRIEELQSQSEGAKGDDAKAAHVEGKEEPAKSSDAVLDKRLEILFEPCAICRISHWEHAENEYVVKHHFKSSMG